MILLGKPKDTSDYIFMLFKDGEILHKKGVIPEYKDMENKGFWFKKDLIKEADVIGTRQS